MPFRRGRHPFFSTLQPHFIYILDDEWICKCIQNARFVRILQKTHTNKLNLVLHGTNMPLMISADVEIQKLFIQKISACFHTVTANTHPVTPLKPQDVPRQILPNGILRIISVLDKQVPKPKSI